MKKRYWFAFLCAALALVLTLAAASADTGDEYGLMTDTSGLYDGDRIILVSDDGNYYQAMAANFTGVQVTVSDKTITEQSGMLVLTLSETEDGWHFAADDGYLAVNEGALAIVTDQANATVWTISITSDGTATVFCPDGSIVFAEQDGAYRFFCGSGGNEIAIYNATFEAEHHPFGDNLWWSYANGKLTIGGSGAMPYFYSGTQPWYQFMNTITEVEIQNGVTSIGRYAFDSCTWLQSVTIPDSVTDIGTHAFSYCTELSEITIPDGVTSIGDYAFSGCTRLQSVTIGNGVTGIGMYAFYNCTGLQSVTIPDGVTYIGSYAFSNCSRFQSITIPDSVTSIGWDAFYGCTGLTSVTIGNGVTSIGRSAFYGCTGLMSVTMPCSTSIGDDAFYNCTKITSVHLNKGTGIMPDYDDSNYDGSPWYAGRENAITVTLDEGIQNIGYYAFYCCTGLTEIMIPDSVTSIGNSAFSGTGLTSITIPDGVTSIGNSAFSGCMGLTSITIPDGVTSIGEGAFSDCTGLTEIMIGNGVTRVGTEAFYNTGWWKAQSDGLVYLDYILLGVKGTCGQIVRIKDGTRVIADRAFYNQTQISKVTIPDSVTSIGGSAFSGCTGLTSVTIGNGVTSIGDSAFSRCTGLQSITIPDSVTDIGMHAFSRCTGLQSITIPDGVTEIDYAMFSYCEGLQSITIPDSVTRIGSSAFEECTGLQSITIPDSVTSIGSWAFYNCTGLQSITIGNGVTSIGRSAFSGCTGLQSVTMGNGVTSIEDYAFSGCTGLMSVTMPCSTSIGDSAFSNCTKITSVHLTKGTGIMPDYTYNSYDCYNRTPWYAGRENAITLTLDEGIQNIGSYAFYECTGLSEITIPDSVTSIGDSAFSRCTGLTSITIPDSVTSIGSYAFSGCTGLTSITIPDSVTSIGSCAFSGCTGLTDVYYNGTKAERNQNLMIGSYNNPLLYATWHYLTEAVDGTVEWNSADVEFKGTTAYVIANGTAQTPRFVVKKAADGSVIDPANYDFEYRENTKAGTGYVIVTFKGDYTGICRGVFKIYLPATTETSVENIDEGIKVSWAPVEGAAGYVIYRRAWSTTTDGWTAFARWNNTTETTYIDGTDAAHKVFAGTRYQYGVKAYFARRTDPVTGAEIGGNVNEPSGNFNLGEVGPLKTTVRITTRTLNSVTAGTKQMTVKWTPSSVFTGYEIQYATNSAFTQNAKAVKITNPKTVSTVIKSLTSGKTYYVRLRSYHEFNGMTYFGEWSNVKNCKVK